MKRTLLVLPNPFIHLDEDGEPMGACPADPVHAGKRRMWIGAELDPVRTVVEKRPPTAGKARLADADDRDLDQVTKFSFVTQPVEIPMTTYYLQRIRDGELLAADRQTYRHVFGSVDGYLNPAEVVARERGMAIDRHIAHWGEPPEFAADAVSVANGDTR
jgi:hypothetical protein